MRETASRVGILDDCDELVGVSSLRLYVPYMFDRIIHCFSFLDFAFHGQIPR